VENGWEIFPPRVAHCGRSIWSKKRQNRLFCSLFKKMCDFARTVREESWATNGAA
jgi:hypothetical protein